MSTTSETRSKGGANGLVEGEFLFTEDDFKKIAQILHSHAGIALAEGKAALVYSRLAKRLRSLGLRSFREYCALVEDKQGVDERQAMMAALTTVLGMVPLYFDVLFSAMAVTIMFGLTFATALILVVVPVLYGEALKA